MCALPFQSWFLSRIQLHDLSQLGRGQDRAVPVTGYNGVLSFFLHLSVTIPVFLYDCGSPYLWTIWKVTLANMDVAFMSYRIVCLAHQVTLFIIPPSSSHLRRLLLASLIFAFFLFQSLGLPSSHHSFHQLVFLPPPAMPIHPPSLPDVQ